jgi:hypothetical protein
MIRIDTFTFGRIVIDGRERRSDVVIYPDGRVQDSWWREEGHRLSLTDLAPVIESAPEILIAGTGCDGLLQPDGSLAGVLARRGIEFIAAPTDEAVQLYNDLAPRRKVAACLHLTC